MNQRTALLMFCLAACTGVLSGCAPVAAWERGTLAKPEMALEADPLASQLDAHVYFSKEASSGGNSASGGGCGCN